MYDVIVVGGGPAGMTAALYALRNGKSALVIEKQGFGGQITHSPKVENYPGTISMSGNEFADHTLDQILKQGAEIDGPPPIVRRTDVLFQKGQRQWNGGGRFRYAGVLKGACRERGDGGGMPP